MRRTGIGIVLLSVCLRAHAGPPKVLEIVIDTPIEPVAREILDRGLQQAARDRAALVILRLDTPGGLLDSTRRMVSSIEASKIPVVAYVAPPGGRAASAGFFLLEAADVAAMAPGTNTGAAHPVSAAGPMEPVMKEKVENDTAAALRSITGKRSRGSALAESAVRQSKSFTEREALQGKLIEFIARDDQDLLVQLDGKTIQRFDGSSEVLHTKGTAILPLELTAREKLLTLLTDPNIALILLVLGSLGIYVEFHAPGLILPGVAGAICSVLGLAALAPMPINGLGVALLILAAVFFALEFKFTSHGILGTGGAVALALGSVMLVNGPIPELRIHWATALGIVLPFGAITAFLAVVAARARRNKAIGGTDSIVGSRGVAVENLFPSGRILTHGEYWTARSPVPVKAGDEVRVVARSGLELQVERMERE